MHAQGGIILADTLLLWCRGAVIEGDSVGRLKTAGRQGNRIPLAENVRA